MKVYPATAKPTSPQGWRARWLTGTLALLPVIASAAADNWTSTVSGAWGTAGNWSSGVPIASSTVTFNTAAGQQTSITLPAAALATSLSFSATGGANAFTFDTAGTVNNNRLTLSGGIINSAAATQTFYNAFTLSGSQSWTANGGAMNFNGNVALGAGASSYTLTVDGSKAVSIAGQITDGGAAAGSLVYAGTGNLTLTGNNTYTGTTSITSGTVTAGSANALGTTAADTTVSSGATLAFQGGITVAEGISVSGTGATANTGAISNTSGANTVSGNIAQTAATTFSAAAGTQLTLSGVISGSAASTYGKGTATGTVVLSGANTYVGATTINAGTLQIQNAAALGNASNTSNTTVASGAVLQLANNISTTNAGTLILNGTGTGSGALQSVSGNNTWDSGITLASNSTIFSSTAGNTLFLNANYVGARTLDLGAKTLTIDGPGDTWINSDVGVAGNTGGVIKNGTGKATFYGYNTYYSGATVVNAGSLDLIVGPFSGGYHGVNGSLTIGTGPSSSGLAGTVNVNIATNSYTDQISPTSAVTINSDGALNVGASTGLGALTLNGGSVNVTAGAAITPTAITSNTNTAHQTSQITGGQVILTGPTTLTVARDATITTDLSLSTALAMGGNALVVSGAGNTTFTGAMTGTAASSLTKNGTGTLILAAANPAFLGSIAVNGGTLQTNIAGAITASNAVTVAAGATLFTNGYNQTLGALTDNGGLNLGAGSILTLTGISALNGTLSGSGTIVLNTGSILTLGANFNNSNINFQLNGGTLKLNGTNDVFGNLVVSGNSIIDFSGGAVADFSSVTFVGGSILTVNNWANAVSYFYSNTTIGAQGSAPANQIVFSGFIGNDTRWNTYSNGPDNLQQITPVPEPATYGLIFVGLSLAGTFVVLARRKNVTLVATASR